MDEIRVRPIGVVRSPYRTPLDAPRQGALAKEPSRIEILAAYAAGLEGIGAGRRLLVVWWAHEADRSTLARPGTDGVFSMRTPHRPNPVCVTEVEVVAVDGAALTVSGLDAVDGSPVLDLKSAEAEHEGWSPLPRGPL